MNSAFKSIHKFNFNLLVVKYYDPLSIRERILVVLGVVVITLWAIYFAGAQTVQTFRDQAERLSDLDSQALTVSEMLTRYSKLKARQEAVEEYYKKIEINEGVRSLLERIVQQKTGMPPGETNYKILPQTSKTVKFGSNYEQVYFSVRFNSIALKALIDFLKEVSFGEKPLLLNALLIEAQRGLDRLSVTVELSSINQTA